MRRPTQHHNIPAIRSAWVHPYTGVTGLGVFYNDGGDGTPSASDPAGTDGQAPKPTPPAQRVFTQAEVEALAAKEKAQGKRSAAKEFAEKHGFSTIEDAETFIATARKAQDDALTEQQKREKDLADREAKAEAREKAAEARERAANRRSVLVGLGASGDDLEDAAALLRVADDADEATLQEAADKLKTRRPELFGATPQTAAVLPPAPGGAPAGSPPRTTAAKDDVQARMEALAEKMGFRNKAA
jgi:hypothetical protein